MRDCNGEPAERTGIKRNKMTAAAANYERKANFPVKRVPVLHRHTTIPVQPPSQPEKQ